MTKSANPTPHKVLAQSGAHPVAETVMDLCADHEGPVEAFTYLPKGTKLYAYPQDALPESVIDAAVAAWFNTEGSFTVRMRTALVAAIKGQSR